ncbi:MAG: bifunctional diguanylate cyclase/phosphodiesterase [Gammaproteobacteria bacterium]|nr:bifunctional diguanylate cyclase/phosphodiesterase [Gammaproteobacteria bacterium]
MPQNRKQKLHSLRARYISFALLLGFVMICGALIGYKITLDDSSKTDEIQARVAQQSDHLEQIKELVHTAYRSMDLFLIDPQKKEQRQVFGERLARAIEHIERMRTTDSPGAQNLAIRLNFLEKKVIQFKVEATELFDVRTDPIRQYPSMEISSRIMQPGRTLIMVALDEAISEAKDSITESGIESYTDFVELKDRLNSMNLFFRLFMVNRSGGFDSAGIVQQAQSIRDIYKTVINMVLHLKEHQEDGDFGFDGAMAIETLENYLPKWMGGFNTIQEVDKSIGWRLDTRIMQQKILPLTDEIAATIQSIDQSIKLENQQIADSHKRIKATQNLLLGILIIIIAFYIIAMLISLDRMVFRPISAVAHALKAEAFGESRENLIQTRTRETQDLIDAFHEMNLQVRNRQMALEYQAMHDALTGLPNRTMLLERIKYQLMVSKREEKPLSLFILDLNRFKEVNDTLGHHIGDQLLVNAGSRFKACLREIDTIARLGGDEFAILLPNTDSEHSETVAQKLVKAIKEPFTVEDNVLYIGVSIGIASFPEDGEDSNTLLQHADVAMYNAKLNHLGYALYNVDEDEHSIGRLSLVQDLRNAIRQDQLELYFQPKVDMFENSPVGAEALLRWKHPELGFIPPDQVVDIAEGVGLIDELTSWVMDRALQRCAQLHSDGYQLSMSINLSVKNLVNSGLSNEIKGLLEKHQISSRFIIFEITESSMMANPENAIQVLNELNGIGVNISVDDFGTGFSSLAYLKQLPVNELKIDKSFVMEMARNDSDAVIVHSTIELGHNLGLYVIAEGVENQQTCDTLKHYGCDIAQGYFISHPLPFDEFVSWLKIQSA